jgi:radical SAM protein with 4Fe4S-binding SPASM domain
MRPDLMDLARYATKKGLRAVISTNGTLITRDKARELKQIGLSYVGVSLDGVGDTNDRFRGVKGAFNMALQGIRNSLEAGIKVGLRFTINKRNSSEIPEIFKLLEEENIPRVCFYHLVYAGRGSELVKEDLNHDETRRVVDQIIDATADLHRRGKPKEVLTVDNHADGVYLYLRMLRENSPRASQVMELLEMNGGNSSGNGIGCVSWNGDIHADQFWRHYSFGNVRKQKFSQVWSGHTNALMTKLKNKVPNLTGRCARCTWKNCCGGNFRVRAEAVTGDLWSPDPACYLTDKEISMDAQDRHRPELIPLNRQNSLP